MGSDLEGGRVLSQREKLKQRLEEFEDKLKLDAKKAWRDITDAVDNIERQCLETVLSNETLAKAVKLTLGNVFDVEDDTHDEDMEETEMLDDTTVSLKLTIESMEHIPVSEEYFESRNIAKSGHCVSVAVLRGQEREEIREISTNIIYNMDGNPIFDEALDIGKVRLDDVISFSVNSSFLQTRLTGAFNFKLGSARVRVSDLIEQAIAFEDENYAKVSLWMTDPLTDTIVFDYDLENPCTLSVSIDRSSLPNDVQPRILGDGEVPELDDEIADKYPKHVFILSRGTRGDVQPFIALARGLAEQKGWLVTICTEERYRPLVNRYADVTNGKIQFRVSGGDTEKRIDTALSKWAFNQKNDFLQMAMLGRSEREFFDSEPAFYYWAKQEKPDVLMFGFTCANLAMLLSEKLQIPLIGFLLQPTGIPSKHYPAVVPLDWKIDPETAHKWNSRIKLFFEHNPLDTTSMLNSIRLNRGLHPYSHRVNNLKLMVNQNIPLIVPINEEAFGGRPDDWNTDAVLTDFIFLRTGAVPNLKPRFMKIILDAHASKEPVIVMCFSSMPVERIKILEMCLMIINHSKRNPRVIALVGNRQAAEVPVEAKTAKSIKIEEEAARAVENGRLLIEGGAPFSKLFPLVDFVLMHGGLGTTAECLLAGVPCMVSGVMILDQRFWGQRVHDLGVAPPPCHIRDLESVIVKNVDAALAPGNKYAARAKQLARKLKESKSGDGVAMNVETIAEIAERAQPVLAHRESITRDRGKLARALAKDVGSALQEEGQNVRKIAEKELRYRSRSLGDGIRKQVSSKRQQLQGKITSGINLTKQELRQRFKKTVAENFLQRHESNEN